MRIIRGRRDQGKSSGELETVTGENERNKLLSTKHQELTTALTGNQEDRTVSSHLDENLQIIKEIFDRCDDLIIHEFVIGRQNPVRTLMVFFDELANQNLQQELLGSMMNVVDPHSGVTTIWLKEAVIPAANIEERHYWIEITNDLCQGWVSLFIDGEVNALTISVPKDNKRSISQPITESVIRGPADGFNEDLNTNLALLRKRLHTSRLAVEKMQFGEVTKTSASLVYLKGYITEPLINEIKTRTGRLQVDAIISSGQIEEFIQDNPYSLFSTIDVTERPDRLVGHLLEGHAGLMLDGSPFALIIPTILASQLTSPEDYYNRYWFSSFIRFLRWVALITALLAPSLYIAIVTFHQEMVPTNLLVSIIGSHEGVPFPGLVEALIMELIFELLREAGVRLPRPFGQTIGVVGAIVIGQTAVSAGLVSPSMVVVVAVTAVASYTIPSMTLSNNIRLLRFPFMLMAGVLGLFGVMASFSLLTFHLCSLRSFGVPYLSPLAPLSLGDLKDTLIRAPTWMMKTRPRLLGYKEPIRQNPDLKPGPPGGR